MDFARLALQKTGPLHHRRIAAFADDEVVFASGEDQAAVDPHQKAAVVFGRPGAEKDVALFGSVEAGIKFLQRFEKLFAAGGSPGVERVKVSVGLFQKGLHGA